VTAAPIEEATMNAKQTDNEVVSDLQATLVELIDLSLLGKQAHWNVVGANFRSIHLQLDEIVDTARLSSDRVAERIATVGEAPDGRASAVAASSGLPEFPGGQVPVTEAVQRVSATIDAMSKRLNERIMRMGESDPVSQDILIGAADELEKQAWMLRAQLNL
jgi:starvation-inducible DNA-binding protein